MAEDGYVDPDRGWVWHENIDASASVQYCRVWDLLDADFRRTGFSLIKNNRHLMVYMSDEESERKTIDAPNDEAAKNRALFYYLTSIRAKIEDKT